MNQPPVSVIIPNYNYACYLREAIDSALNQTYRNIEIIVVDDGSQDNSAEVLESYSDKIKFIQQQNQGVSAARNVGFQASSGDYIAFLDADDVWLPQKIEKQIKRFLDDVELGLVHVGLEDIDADGNKLKIHVDGLEGWVSQELLLFKRPVILGGGSGMLIPRKIFEETGGFDLQLSTSADWDIFYQISSRYQVGFVPEILMKYRVHDSNMHSNIPRMEREMMIGYKKAFSETSDKVQSIKRTAYGNLHQVLAGSYFRAGQYSAFAKHALRSIRLTPTNFIYFASFPLRFLRRKTS